MFSTIRLSLFILLLFSFSSVTAQNKLFFQFDVSVLNSIGSNKRQTVSSPTQNFSIVYFSPKKYSHPYLNLLTSLNYDVNKNISAGIQSGLYFIFKEQYWSTPDVTTISVPVFATLKFSLFKIRNNSAGLDLKIGTRLLPTFTDEDGKVKNGLLYGGSFFYTINGRNTLKVGLEKETQHYFYNFTSNDIGYHNEVLEFPVQRISAMLSYGILLHK